MQRDTMTDVESFPNFFCCVVKYTNRPDCGVFEISERRNDVEALVNFILTGIDRMFGFNNTSYDYIMLHGLCHSYMEGELNGLTGQQIAERLYQLNNQIIEAQRGERVRIWERDYLVPQVDLMKVHHLDNRARATSLKALQFFMRSRSIEESPVPFGTWLRPDQMDSIISYCAHDVCETDRFRELSLEQLAFRETLDAAREPGAPSWMNLSDTSIGKRFFRERMERVNPGCTRNKTERSYIPLGEIIFPWIQFKHEPFQRQLRMLQDTTLHVSQVKGAKFASVLHHGFTFDFGAGGLHGSVTKERVRADNEHAVVDIDVTSFYPRLATVNGFYPEHLGPEFCVVYDQLFQERALTQKGDAKNLMLKLALNGVFGDSNNQYGPFYDTAYTLKTTINGQLVLCMLAEALMDIPTLRVIQANTDGLTVRVHRAYEHHIAAVMDWWQQGTALQLERVDYSQIIIRDVNNYIAVPADTTKKPKRKGAYEYELDWWQDPSALVVPKATEAALLHGVKPRDFVAQHVHADPWDFMLRTKVPRGSRLYYGSNETGWRETQRVSRYYIGGTRGEVLYKVMPPKAGSNELREISVQKGMPVVLCNTYDGQPLTDANLDWYAKEAGKLLI